MHLSRSLVWPRSGRAAAAAWRSQRQPTEEFMALGISSKLLKIPFGIFQLKYMGSSASFSPSPFPSEAWPCAANYATACNAGQVLVPHSRSQLEKMQLNAFWSCLACAAHSGDFVLTFAACFGISSTAFHPFYSLPKRDNIMHRHVGTCYKLNLPQCLPRLVAAHCCLKCA